MPDILATIRSAITKGFKGKFKKALLIRKRMATGESDEDGDDIVSGVIEYPCEGLVLEYDALFRARAGIPDLDVQVMIFAGTLPDGVTPSLDDRIKVPNPAGATVVYQLRKRETDPANATWSFQAFEVQA